MSQDRPNPTRWMRYVWLIYLAALFFQPAFDPTADILDWVAVAGLIALFLPIYGLTFRAGDDLRALALIASLATLGLVGSLVNAGASVFVVFGAGVAGNLHPPRRAAVTVGLLWGVVALMVVVSPMEMPWRVLALTPALFFTPVVGATAIFDAERDRSDRRLQRADAEIERLATLAERERIARDLHDLLGHTLSVIVLKSELASRLVRADPDRAAAEAHDIEQIGREALGEVRAAVAGYRWRGLPDEVHGARVALQAAGIDARVRVDPIELTPDHESALAMAVREAVTNVVRHSGAGRAMVSIEAHDGQIRLTVTDDGQGLSGRSPGSGLTGMRERVAAIGGRVEVHDAGPLSGGRGTTVQVVLPVGMGAGEPRSEGRSRT